MPPITDNDRVSPPGTGDLKATLNRSTGWYCLKCAAFVRPVWLRVDKTVYPACLECFYDEVGDKLHAAKKGEDHEPATLPLDTSGVTWDAKADVSDLSVN